MEKLTHQHPDGVNMMSVDGNAQTYVGVIKTEVIEDYVLSLHPDAEKYVRRELKKAGMKNPDKFLIGGGSNNG